MELKPYKLIYEDKGLIKGSQDKFRHEDDAVIVERATIEGKKAPVPVDPEGTPATEAKTLTPEVQEQLMEEEEF